MTDRAPLFRGGASVGPGRRRAARRAEVTSDQRRFIGVGAAALVGGLTSLGFALGTADPASLQSPGPLARPHVQAGLTCASCHEASGQPQQPASACVGCHGPHPSTRAGHRSQAQAGALQCVTCHRVHRDMGGVASVSAGERVQWLRFGPGAEVAVPGQEAALGGSAGTVVPIVPVQPCAECHDPAQASDPIQRCLLAGQDGLGDERPTVCLDEHRRLDGLTVSDAATRKRLTAWGTARQVVAQVPVAPRKPSEPPPSWQWLGFGLLTGTLTWLTARLLARRGARVAEPPPPSNTAMPAEVRRLPVVNTATCIGCYACVDACPYDVLTVERYVAKVVRADDCCGLTLCEQRCPNGSLVITDGDPVPDLPAMDEALQSRDVPGLYLAGDLTGLPLIRNAINQGAAAVESVVQSRRARGPSAVDLDVVIVGAGPAGVSAGLAAQGHGLKYQVLEQGSVAESIRSFPRGKLVFDQPLGLPMVGDLWLAESTKEELVGKWLRIVRQRDLSVLEQTRVVEIERGADGNFTVETQTAAGPVALTAAHVVLAIGRRGTPRKLPIALPDAVLDRVHYSMADARSFAGQRVLVVGLGDVAMEAAVALSRQKDTVVTVAYRGAGFSRGKQRNVEEVKRRVAAGRVTLCLRTEVTQVDADTLTLTGPEGERTEPWDALLVLIGSIAPWEFLGRVGVRRATAALKSPHEAPVL